jgi:hypothetical protein
MEKDREDRAFNTLRGALSGDEPDEPMYFAYSASLRICGCNPSYRPHEAPDDALVRLDMTDIESRLGVQATTSFRQGETRRHDPPRRWDGWFYEPSLPEDRPLEDHIDALWTAIRPGSEYLRALKKTVLTDVFLGYRSNCDHAGIEIPHTSLEMFTELEIPFGISIILT